MFLLVKCFRLFAFFVFAFLCCHPSQAQDSRTSSDTNSEEAEKFYQFFEKQANAFEAKLANGVPLKLEKPLLRWTIGNSWHGCHYIWTCQNRPTLIGCFLTDSSKLDRRQVYVEMHTLTEEPYVPMNFTGIKNYQWAPKSIMTSTVKVENIVSPHADSRVRKNQMRQIAESFSLQMYEDKSTGNGKEALRMLTTPLYRYPEDGPDSKCGSLYAYVRTNGTDPEFLLAIEFDPASKKKEWVIHPIRYTTRRLELSHGGKIVWSVDEYDMSATQSKLDDPYMIITILETETNEFNAFREQMIRVEP